MATPIGNLEDLTFRALRTLREVDLIACEDTRRTGALLRAHGISTPMTSFFEHNERFKGERVLAALRAGRSVALVSDAGTPGISDPGYRLVRDARAAGFSVVPIPGPSAAVAALSVSGLPTDRFLFVGFLPSRPGPRRRALRELVEVRPTLVFYESPVRLAAALADMAEILGNRDAFLCREATKAHEEYRRGHLLEIRERLADRGTVRGEIVLVVSGASGVPPSDDQSPEDLFTELVSQGFTRRGAVKEVAHRLRLPAREVYGRVLKIRKDKTPID